MISSLLETLQDPSTRHALFVHFPVVLAALTFPIAILAALLATKRKEIWHLLALLLIIAFTISAYLSVKAGHAAEGNLGAVITAVSTEVHEHEEAAEYLHYFGIIASLIALMALAENKKIRLTGAYLTPLTAAFILYQTGIAAHLGGDLVYEYGAGTPNPITQAQHDIKTGAASALPENDPRLPFFRNQIKPQLNEYCFGCHGPDSDTGFTLTTFTGILNTGVAPDIVVPGNAEASYLIETLEWQGDLKMPKGEAQFSPATIADFRKWINDGAVWE